VVFVGLQRFAEKRQREQIQAALIDDYGIRLSTGEISTLAKRFVDYLGRLHRARYQSLKALLDADGGWPMHVDATGEQGRGTLFVVMTGWRQWVLGAWKPATENAELILPCMREAVRLFGPPCAVVRDMGRAVTPAVDKLIEEIGIRVPVLTCHQHFLADIGKDLLEPGHAALRGLFKRTAIRGKLRELARDLGRKLGPTIENAHEAVINWQTPVDPGHSVPNGREGLAVVRSITQWALDYSADATGHDFPFDRPYLDFYQRCPRTLRATDAFSRRPPQDRMIAKLLQRLNRILAPVQSQVPFQQHALRLRRRAKLFDELRDILRLAAEVPEQDSVAGLAKMRDRFQQWTDSLSARRPTRGPGQDIRQAIDVILKHVQCHGHTLWGHAILVNQGAERTVRLVSRTNCLLENSFKHLKHGERRRSGRRILTQDLEHLPAESALVANLKKQDYVEALCGSLDRLPESFASLDEQARRRQLTGAIIAQPDDLSNVLQTSTASLAPSDRRVVRSQAMGAKMLAAANSRAPRMLC